MTRVFVYEWVSAGASELGPAADSLRREGAAMLRALARDFADDPGVRLDTIVAAQSPLRGELPGAVHVARHEAEERDLFARLTAEADWTVVIAPESAGILLDRCRLVEDHGGRLLGPSPVLVALTSDKHATAEHLETAGIAVPDGMCLPAGSVVPRDFPRPAILKPCDGAGSQGVRFLKPGTEDVRVEVRSRLEAYVPGVPASVALLCGPSEFTALPPGRQRLCDGGSFAYQGGELPLPAPLARRAAELALRAVRSLPGALGYLGVDLVLGEQGDGSGDYIIEVNPRLTTSYVGLRALLRENLASAMLAAAEGLEVALSCRAGCVQFDPDGTVCHERFSK